MLTKEQILELFERLNKKLKDTDAKGEIGIVGGAVMCLVYNARPSTKDIDGVFMPTQQIREFVRQIADELGLSNKDWLNDGAKGYIQGIFKKKDILNFSNLVIWAPEPKYMLAMKCISARIDTKDQDDVRFLIRHLGLKTKEEVFQIISKFYPNMKIQAKVHFFIEEIFDTK